MKFLHKLPRATVTGSRDEAILEVCRGKTVLHLGFVDEGLLEERISQGSWLHASLVKAAKRAIGIDISEQGVARARELGYGDCYVANVEELEQTEGVPKIDYEVVLAADIIEHLDNPGKFLQEMRSFVGPRGSLVLTTPSALSIKTLFCAPAGLEIVHPDHNCYFSPWTLTHLLSKYGFTVTAITLYSPRFVPTKANIAGVWDGIRKWAFVAMDDLLRWTVVRAFPYFNHGMLIVAGAADRESNQKGVAKVEGCIGELTKELA